MRIPLYLITVLSLVLASAGAAQADPAPERQQELLHLLMHDCGSCHGMTLKGGLGPALTPDRLASRSEQTLATTILNGVPNSAMPPWRPLMSEDDAAWLAHQLRKGVTHGG